MIDIHHLEIESRKSLTRILPRVEQDLKRSIAKDPQGWAQFTDRLSRNFPALLGLYAEVYSDRYDFFHHLEDLVASMARSWFSRPLDLRELDRSREQDPQWFQSNQMLGGVCYVDLFAKNLDGIRKKIPYFKELGLTYLHLMPLFKAPEGENDGGYAVSSYREVNPSLGTMKELSTLARDFRRAGISLVVDLVFNHTSDEHIWAQRAKQGDEEYMDFYRIFPSRELPSLYERDLREIFPEEHSGAFSPFIINGREHWVWTTFHSYQWDLNYANPAVFNRMAEEMLFLANQGVEVLRLDAVAFIWKQLGTNCENLPQAHTLIKAFNAVARIASPALLFKSEAIVHPDDVVKYISLEECQVSYNPLLMALLWNSLATRETRLLGQALAARFKLQPGTAWVNYVRVHDDIGWTFSDEDAAHFGVNGYDHRRFLNEFYRGRFPGSFARGLPFQENPSTGDCRISGTGASLAGLEKALNEEGEREVELAIRRILLIHGVILAVGGIPLIYLGDEIGTLNDYTYRDDPAHERDSRWVHRPRADWDKYKKRHNLHSLEGHIFHGFHTLIDLRKQNTVFAGGDLEVVPTENDHILGFMRTHAGKRAMVFANFSESPQTLPARIIEQYAVTGLKKLHGRSHISIKNVLTVEPLDFVVFG
ncbi:MAG TPA: alpha-amylase family glycosyl hydrolase [Anaerolineales bacterium]|nr:alpha-amylase family glycosyl hydrolase [Anaerolineales bacterium]HNN14294.1 alpha-amylase family glycosyl hydrolase [Anaerolineales bacterium]HNO30169.1 alpha-amylase family glycosyl hydrolase [Anaerolineales bacterium]